MAVVEGETCISAFPPEDKPRISYGIPFHQACAHHIDKTFQASRVYIIVSNSISKTDDFRSLEKVLGDRVVGVRKGIKPHTPWDDVLEIVEDIKSRHADIIVTLGAGSLTDGAKVVAFALANNATDTGSLSSLTAEESSESTKPISIPVINIPTSLSGGEYSAFAGATDTRNHQKRSFSHPSMGADLIILDPKLSVTTPERIWLSTGIRAVDHCVEALCSLSEMTTAETDESAKEGLKMLVQNLLNTKKDWDSLEPRMAEMLGVVEAMKAVRSGVPMGGSHGIGHQLGPLGVGHGETSCIMLPAVLKWSLKEGSAAVEERQRKVQEMLWNESVVAEVLKRRGLGAESTDLGDIMDAIIVELGMPRTLKDVGVGRDKLDALADNSLKDRWLKTNPVPIINKQQVLEILEMVAGPRTVDVGGD